MNRLLKAIAAAMLIACYALPVRAEAPPKFADHTVKVYTGRSDVVANTGHLVFLEAPA